MKDDRERERWIQREMRGLTSDRFCEFLFLSLERESGVSPRVISLLHILKGECLLHTKLPVIVSCREVLREEE